MLQTGSTTVAPTRLETEPSRAARLDEAWDLRLGGKTDEAYDRYLDLLGELNVRIAGASVAGAWQSLTAKGMRPAEALELLLLDVSFHRYRRETAEAERKTEELGALAEAAGLRLPASYLLQSALNALAAGSHSLALERFLQAKRRADRPRELQLAAFNALLCMEDLGLEFGPSLDVFLAAFAPHESAPWAASILGQLDALRLRAAFRAGDFAALRRLISSPARGEQTLYFAAWVADLPHLGFPELASAAKERFAGQIATTGIGYHSAFRLRTLNGLLIEEDLGNVRVSEKIERLYLWTWRWLAKPESAALAKILLLQDSIRRQSTVLAGDDHRIFSLSLRWLGLFAGLSTSELDRLFQGHSAAESRAVPQLECEGRLLDYLFAARDGSRFAADTKQSLFHESPACAERLATLFSGDAAGLAALSDSIRALETARDEQPGVTVELLKRRITADGEEILSEPLTKLLELFRSSERAGKAQVLSHVFGIRRYEPELHDQKLANLLSKANRQFADTAQFSTKGDQVIARIQRERLHFAECDLHTLSFAQADLSLLLADDGKQKEKNLAALTDRWVSRSELEAGLGVSRATAARWLKSRVDSGEIEAKGSGKNVRYRIPQEAL